jgi:hypothetical protein
MGEAYAPCSIERRGVRQVPRLFCATTSSERFGGFSLRVGCHKNFNVNRKRALIYRARTELSFLAHGSPPLLIVSCPNDSARNYFKFDATVSWDAHATIAGLLATAASFAGGREEWFGRYARAACQIGRWCRSVPQHEQSMGQKLSSAYQVLTFTKKQ